MQHRPFYEQQNTEFRMFEMYGGFFAPHLHEHTELIWLREGECEIIIDSKSYLLKPGACGVVFPNVIHSYGEKSKNAKIWIAIFSNAYAGEQQGFLLKNHPSKPVISKSALHTDAKYALRRLAAENGLSLAGKRDVLQQAQTANERQKEYDMLISALFQLFLARSLKLIEPVRNGKADSYSDLQRALRYVTQEFQNTLSLEDAAKQLEMSPYRLSRIFTKGLQISFTRYVQQLRVEKAKELLTANAEKQIVDIAFECGFETLRNFNRVFQSTTGISPREYKKGGHTQ